MDAVKRMYAAYEKYVADHRLEDEQGIKAAFIEGYYQAMFNAENLLDGEQNEKTGANK